MAKTEKDIAENSSSNQFSIEESFEQLEEMLTKLESEEIGLEESFSIYEKGMKLLKDCDGAIDQVEKKVLVLQENGECHEFS